MCYYRAYGKSYIYICTAVVLTSRFKNVLKLFVNRKLGESVIKEIIRWIYAPFYGAGHFMNFR